MADAEDRDDNDVARAETEEQPMKLSSPLSNTLTSSSLSEVDESGRF